MSMALDVTNWSNKDFLQILKSNDEFCTAIATLDNWDDLKAVIDSLDINYTSKQLGFIEEYFNSKNN